MNRTRILLSAQRALLGMITPNMRAITVGWQGPRIRLRFYFSYPPSEAEIELTSTVAGEMIADFEEATIAEEAMVSQEKLSNLELLDAWIYIRRE